MPDDDPLNDPKQYDAEMEFLPKCGGCGKPIDRREIQILIPEEAWANELPPGFYHRDCGIMTEASEDGGHFEDNIMRQVTIWRDILQDWTDPEHALELLRAVNKAVARLNREVKRKYDPFLKIGKAKKVGK